MRTKYLTTDLDLEGPEDLRPIQEAFGEDVSVHWCGPAGGRYQANFGLLGTDGDATSDIAFLCRLAESLGEAERSLWNACTRIEFNAGFEAGSGPRSWRSLISAEVLERVARLGGDLVVTIYPESAAAS